MGMHRRACLGSIRAADHSAGACPSDAKLLAATPAADGSKLQSGPSIPGRWAFAWGVMKNEAFVVREVELVRLGCPQTTQ